MTHRIPLALIFILGFIALCCIPSDAQTVVSLCSPVCQFFDGSGNLLSNGTISTFAAGTTSNQPTYTDSTGLVANTNPIRLNAAGMPSNNNGAVGIFLTTAAYKFVAKNSLGVQVWSQDGIALFNSTALLKGVSANCSSPGPATSGFLQMCNGDLINWRNIANSANIGFRQAGAAATGTGNVADVLQYGSSTTGAFQAQRYLDFSTAPAQSGVLAGGNGVCLIASRNAAGLGDICALLVNGANVTVLGGSAGVSINGSTFTIPATTATGEVSFTATDTITSAPLGNGGSVGWKYVIEGSGATTSYAVGVAAATEVHLMPTGSGTSWFSIFGASLPNNDGSSSAPDTHAVASIGTNGQIRDKRTLCSNASHYSGSDSAVILSANWGTGSAHNDGGCDEQFSLGITSGSAAAGANPTATVTFKDGSFSVMEAICVRNDTTAMASGSGLLTWTTPGGTSSSIVITLNGTPNTTSAYNIQCSVKGQ